MRHLSIDQYSSASVALALFLLTQGLNQDCAAQQSNVAGQKPPMVKKTVADMLKEPRAPQPHPEKPIVDVFGKSQKLTEDKVIFDDLPKYTGKAKFRSGQVFHNTDQRQTTMMMVDYSATEDIDQVKEWYANAFRMYGWNVTRQTESLIGATNSKTSNTCNIQFCKTPGSKVSRCEFQIDYCQVGKP